MAECLGSQEAEALCHVLTQPAPPVSIRLNPLKLTPAPAAATEGLKPVAWCAKGR